MTLELPSARQIVALPFGTTGSVALPNITTDRSIEGGQMGRLRFMHVPKTAGTTLSQILGREYGKAFTFTGNIEEDLARYQGMPERVRNRLRLINGHAPISVGLSEIDQLPIITVLREPVARVQSFCCHVAAGRSPYLHEWAKSFDLDTFLQSDVQELSNLQTKLLINHGRPDAPDRLSAIRQPEAIDTAVATLFEHVSLFGLQEEFDEMVLYFADRLRWTLPPYYLTENVRPSETARMIFEPRHLDMIRELNSTDIAVYERALREYRKRLSTCNAVTPKAISEFTAANHQYQSRRTVYRGLRNVSRQLLTPIRAYANRPAR